MPRTLKGRLLMNDSLIDSLRRNTDKRQSRFLLKYQTSPSNQLLAMAKYSRSQELKRVARGVGAATG